MNRIKDCVSLIGKMRNVISSSSYVLVVAAILFQPIAKKSLILSALL